MACCREALNADKKKAKGKTKAKAQEIPRHQGDHPQKDRDGQKKPAKKALVRRSSPKKATPTANARSNQPPARPQSRQQPHRRPAYPRSPLRQGAYRRREPLLQPPVCRDPTARVRYACALAM